MILYYYYYIMYIIYVLYMLVRRVSSGRCTASPSDLETTRDVIITAYIHNNIYYTRMYILYYIILL